MVVWDFFHQQYVVLHHFVSTHFETGEVDALMLGPIDLGCLTAIIFVADRFTLNLLIKKMITAFLHNEVAAFTEGLWRDAELFAAKCAVSPGGSRSFCVPKDGSQVTTTPWNKNRGNTQQELEVLGEFHHGEVNIP